MYILLLQHCIYYHGYYYNNYLLLPQLQLSSLLNEEVICTVDYIQALWSKFELISSIRFISSHFFDPISSLYDATGSGQTRHAYWNEYVKKTCIQSLCSNVNTIQRRVMNFGTTSDFCSCPGQY